jgi:5-methylthioadenosine/S-adenosylhomocysteine deaminase
MEGNSLSVLSGRISALSSDDLPELSLADSFVYPSLINAHDHMRGNYLPRVGPAPGVFYTNWGPWDADLKASKTFEERENCSEEMKYALSAYKNLFSAAVTVQDHFPHKLNDPFIKNLPVRVITNYTLAHECSSYDLKWGDGMEIEHRWAVERGWPFITHLEEGFDPESQDGVGILERAGCLDSYDLLIHCVGFSDDDIRKVARAKASVCWCPASNIFMFNVTCKIRKMIQAGINVSIGTDSTHTGSINLLEEMRYAQQVYRDMYDEDLPAKALFEMVTLNPAKALKIEAETGSISLGKRADIMVTRANKADPYENFTTVRPEDIRLLLLNGEPLLGEAEFQAFFGLSEGYARIRIGGRDMFVKGDPAGLLSRVRKAVGFAKKLEYLPFEA